MISGKTTLIAHIGFPTESFKASMIYNPWFDRHGIDAAVIPMGVRPEDYPSSVRSIFRMSNVRGALVTMPHKVVTNSLVDELTPTARIAGASNAILLRPDGTLLGDQFDGAGFVRGVQRKGLDLAGKRVLVSGNGGVGSAIAASLAAGGVAQMALFDGHAASSQALAGRLREHYPKLEIGIG
ncbi:MAG TPA: shikimate dehydrogenase, partial [Burkholderiaceae bacterium]